MAQREKETGTGAAMDSDFDDRVRRLCERLEVPFDIPDLSRWALIGGKLAANEPEFKQSKKRGRPKGGHYPFDQTVLDVIEQAAISQQRDFDEVFRAALKHPRVMAMLGDADRTTHPKRLRRQYTEGVRNAPPTLANTLLKPYRDKIVRKWRRDK